MFGRTKDEYALAKKRLEQDTRTPLKRWAYGVYGIVTRDYDYAHTPRWTLLVNQSAWHLTDLGSLEARLHDFSGGADANGFDLGRSVILLRAAVGLDWLNDEESWVRVTRLLLRLQAQCLGWEDYAEQYLRGRRHWLALPVDGSRDDIDTKIVVENVSRLRKTVWRTTPFRLPLE